MSEDERQLVAPDAVSQNLDKYKPSQLLEVIEGLKPLLAKDPEQARALLEQNPDLAYAVLQAMFLMGLVDENVIEEAMKASNINSNQAPPPQEESDVVGQPKSTEDKLKGLDSQQAEMIRAVLQLTEEQIRLLPGDQQQQVRNLRQMYS